MAGPTTEVLADDLKVMAKSISDFRIESATEFAGFRSRVETQIAMIKWVGVFFSGILVALFTGAVTLAWHASAMNSEVKQQGRRVVEMADEVKQQGQRIERMESEVKRLGQQIDKVEKNTDTILQRLDRLAQAKANPDR